MKDLFLDCDLTLMESLLIGFRDGRTKNIKDLTYVKYDENFIVVRSFDRSTILNINEVAFIELIPILPL